MDKLLHDPGSGGCAHVSCEVVILSNERNIKFGHFCRTYWKISWILRVFGVVERFYGVGSLYMSLFLSRLLQCRCRLSSCFCQFHAGVFSRRRLAGCEPTELLDHCRVEIFRVFCFRSFLSHFNHDATLCLRSCPEHISYFVVQYDWWNVLILLTVFSSYILDQTGLTSSTDHF